MAYTSQDLAVFVLRKLRVIDAAEEAEDVEPEILSIVTDAYLLKWEEMSAHGKELTYWPYNDIPPPVVLTLRDLIALEVQESFGQNITPEDKEAREAVIMRKLRTHVHVPSSGHPVMMKYF